MLNMVVHPWLVRIGLRFIVLTGVILFGFVDAFSTDIYVSAKGNDHNPGTKASPLATLRAARDKIRSMTADQRSASPIQVIIEAGNYYLDTSFVLSPEDSGTETAPVIYRSEGRIKPVIHGGKQLPPFEQVSSTLWKVAVPGSEKNGWVFEQLFVNGKRATRAQAPPIDSLFRIRDITETTIRDTKIKSWPDSVTGKIRLSPSQMQWAKTLANDGYEDVVLTFFHNWDITRRKIKGIDLQDSTIMITGEGIPAWNPVNSKSTFIPENAKSFLDEAGEWFLDPSGILYYIPRPGETLASAVAIAPAREQLLILEGNKESQVQYLRFENMAFGFTSYTMQPTGYQAEQAASMVKAVITADHASHISFTNCEISHTANYGIWFSNGCSEDSVKQCLLKDLGAGGIKIGHPVAPASDNELTHDITIDNNIIVSGGHLFPTAVGVIIFHSGNNTVTHNDISDLGYTGISVGWVWGYSSSYAKNNHITYNHIHHLGWGILSDMGGVYLLGPAPGTTVNNNTIHHIYSYDYGGWGLYTDEGSTGVVLENNLVYACKSSGFHQHYGKENFIRNNIFASQYKAQLQATRVEDHLSFTFSHNIIYYDKGSLTSSNWTTVRFLADSNSYWDTRTRDIRFDEQTFKKWQAAGKDKHSVIADPQFVNPAQFNFKIRNKQLLSTIGFKPFDYSQAGVYGTTEWKKEAESTQNITAEFVRRSLKQEFKD